MMTKFTSVKPVCAHFSKYFVNEIEIIRSKLLDKVQIIPSVKNKIKYKMNVFESATEDENKELILSSSSKSCDLDPIPTKIVLTY